MNQAQLQEIINDLELVLPEQQHLLLVDDEPANLEVLAFLLEDLCTVHTAESAHEGLKILQAEKNIDLLIADQRMPQMTGVEFLAQVAQLHPDTIRMVLTAYSDIEPMVAAINQGYVFRFMIKPFDPEEMRSVVQDALELKRTSAALQLAVERLAEQSRMLSATNRQLVEAKEERGAERLELLGRIISSVTNDFMNQQSIVARLKHILEQEPLPPKGVQQMADNLQKSIDVLLERLSCIDRYVRSAAVAGERQLVAPYGFLDVLLSMLELLPEPSRRAIQVDLDPTVPSLYIDVVGTRQALLALVENAYRASGPDQMITLRMRALASDEVCFEVEDHGCGMDGEIVSQAVQPFFSKFEGANLGLGLPLAKMVAEAQGGRLEIKSQPNQGTVARLTLGYAQLQRGM
jgi:C4-dicarboxylate-specific signal transduction histidine kinase